MHVRHQRPSQLIIHNCYKLILRQCIKSLRGRIREMRHGLCILSTRGKHFFRDYSKLSHFGQNAKSQFWPIFIAELRKLRKIGNTYGFLVKIALSDKEFIVVCGKTKTSKNQRLFAEK